VKRNPFWGIGKTEWTLRKKKEIGEHTTNLKPLFKRKEKRKAWGEKVKPHQVELYKKVGVP